MSDIIPATTLQERVGARIRDQIGDLMTDAEAVDATIGNIVKGGMAAAVAEHLNSISRNAVGQFANELRNVLGSKGIVL